MKNRIDIIWVRHGATPGNLKRRYIGSTDEPILPEEEERLAGIREKMLQESPFPCEHLDAVWSSPLIRCRQTAAILFPGQDILIDDDLRECDFGIFENRNFQELDGDADYQRWVDSGCTLPIPGGESMGIQTKRSCEALDRIIADCIVQGKNTIALTVHGGTIMSIFSVMADQKKEYYEWHVGNGEGYYTWIDGSRFAEGEKVLHVDGRF